jgi:hypothetical protein
MTTIIAGSPAHFAVTVQRDGQPVAITGALEARVFSMDGKDELIGATAVDSAAAGADWPSGVVVVDFTNIETAVLAPGDAMLVLSGDIGIRRFSLTVETLFEPTRTSLFIKDIVVDELRKDRLMAAAQGILQDVVVSDDYLWQKIRAAESEISHTLRVPLVPTRYFPNPPTQDELDALEGMAWEIEIGNDYTPDMFAGDKWGFIATRQKPIISIDRLQFSYPSQGGSYFDIPIPWVNFDAKYGHVRIVPSSNAVLNSVTGYVLTNMVGGRLIPSMVQMTYTAGLTNVSTTYPELLDAIKKMAVLKIVGDAFFPKSGSISGDGLSESMSVDMSDYYDSIDAILNGPKGSNGGLMSKIHGIRVMVMGG